MGVNNNVDVYIVRGFFPALSVFNLLNDNDNDNDKYKYNIVLYLYDDIKEKEQCVLKGKSNFLFYMKRNYLALPRLLFLSVVINVLFKTNRLFAGNIGDSFIALFYNVHSAKNKVILDDGSAGIMYLNDGAEYYNKLYNIKRKWKFLELLDKVLRRKYCFIENEIIYSIFKPCKIENRLMVNDLGVMKRDDIKYIEQVLIVGSPYVECNVVDFNQYDKLINEVIDYHLAIDKVTSFVYRSHPREAFKKLSALSRKGIDFNISESNRPFEIEYIEKNTMQKYVSGFSSTILFVFDTLNTQLIIRDFTPSFNVDIKNHENYNENVIVEKYISNSTKIEKIKLVIE